MAFTMRLLWGEVVRQHPKTVDLIRAVSIYHLTYSRKTNALVKH